MVYLYDGTYKGLLTVLFESYRLKAPARQIVPEYAWQETLFDQPMVVETKEEWAKRVLKGVEQKTSKKSVAMLYKCFLSEKPDIELKIHDFVRKAMKSTQNIEGNFIDPTVLELQQIDKMMGREIHRMHAFVRFQYTKDGIYYSVIEPDFNVLPLIGSHFEKRYPAQNWLIYDAIRHYGLYFNQTQTETITFAETGHRQLKQLSPSLLQEKETAYQDAWKLYFKSTNIPERRNMKLHLQHVPRRYWKYLVEK